MRVFVSWSGERSRRLAHALRDWIPYVLHALRKEDIWFSEVDIEPGKLWARDLGDVLADTRVGLICLTHENRQASWLHFEAGALAKHLDHAKVIPVLYGLQPEDLAGSPLAQFQAIRLIQEDLLKMLLSLNSELGEARVAEDVLKRSLDHNWPDLETRLRELDQLKIDDMDALPGVIEVFSHRGLAEPHLGRIVHFEEGFESHTLYNILCDVAVKRLLIFGRKNRKLFDKEHRDFLDSLPRRIAEGFDFRCLFLNPNSPEAVLHAAHADDDFPEQLEACVQKARAALEQRHLAPEDHLRVYSSHRTVNLIIADDAVLFAQVKVGPDGRQKSLTKCGFSVVDCRLSLGDDLLRIFSEAWEGATPLGGSA
ncbi:MAG TPA: TIR domain-containing protein [Thermoanaerobaculia bacterium]|nr:TIR domain-containing protein [Thermoanaerobaculia bacterium]